jgi:hypothetical protein
MNLTIINKDPRSVIYKYISKNDLYVLRCTNIMFKKEIKPVSIKIKEIAELNKKNDKLYDWFIKDDNIKYEILRYYFDSDNFKLFKIYIHYLDPNTKSGIQLFKYIIDNDKTNEYIKEVAYYNSGIISIFSSWRYEIINYADKNSTKKIYKLLFNILLKYIEITSNLFLMLSLYGLTLIGNYVVDLFN